MDRYPLEIRSKSIWHRKVRKVIVPQKKWTRIEKLRKATPGPQFRGNLLDFQREGLDFLLKSYGNALLADEMGLGKCIKGDALISTTNGSIPIKEIWEQAKVTEQDGNEEWAKLKTPISIQTFDGEKIISKQVNRVFRQKINETIIKIILKDGSEIECTKRHRFLTPDGWKRASELNVNDKVAVPSKTIHDGKGTLSKDIAELMAWQIAEGYEYIENDRYPHGRFYNSDSKILSRVQELAKQQGVDLPKARKELTTHVIATTPLYKIFSKYGYEWGRRSKDKKVPRAIIEAPLEVQKAFVQAMFDSEGHVGKTHCEITTASKSIALSLGEIFRHFGIWLRIRVAKKYATNGTRKRRTYYVCTFGENSIDRFAEQFQLISTHKKIALEKLARKKHNTNIEGVPSHKIVQKIADTGISFRSLNLYTPYKYTQGMSKQLVIQVSDKLESTHHDLAQQLREISLESINWCPIKSVEEKSFSGHVYDLSIPQTHNYIANGIITHNTVQTLAYLATEKQTFPVLIVAPLVTLNNWQRETQKFLKKRSRNGKISENEYPSSVLIRTGKAQELGKYDVYIINYDLLHKRIDDLAKINIKTVVCDEVQHLRSKTTKKYTAVKKLAALDSVKYRVGLSGTPIYNRGSEIWPIVDILRPGLLGTFDEFCEYFCYVNEKGKAIVLENKRASLGEELRKHVMLRRKKSDVLKELKDKVRYKELIDSDINYYQTELGKIWERLEAEQKSATSAFDKFSSYKRAIQSERQAAGVAKVPHVIEFVKNIMEIEESVVVFCHHKAIHELLHRSLSEYTPASIIGGQSDKERQEGIDRFQNGETKLIIAGLRAGNVGINLSRARYVIFAELDWSPAIHRQAEDRLHRIGQKNTVFAYYLMGNGTLDDHVANVLVDKSYEIDAIMDEKAETFENKEKAELILAQIHDKLTHNIAR
ncbi:MAG TPA: SNF2-related protein [Candidatus Nitrosotalea sp.]|nr:SNF2-related protein [Candidatus Nitrosotalea sp.]